MTWTPIVKSEGVRGTLLHDPIELRRNYASIEWLSTSLSSDINIVKLVEIPLLCTNYLVYDVDRLVHLCIPFAKEGLGSIHLLVIYVDFLAKAAELLQPSDANSLSWHRSIEGVLTKFGILLLVSESAN